MKVNTMIQNEVDEVPIEPEDLDCVVAGRRCGAPRDDPDHCEQVDDAPVTCRP